MRSPKIKSEEPENKPVRKMEHDHKKKKDPKLLILRSLAMHQNRETAFLMAILSS